MNRRTLVSIFDLAGFAKRTWATACVIALMSSFVAVSSLQAQSTKSGEMSIGRQSAEAADTVLRNAERKGSLVEGTIEIAAPLSAATLDGITLPGEIQSIDVASITSDWKGAIYSTPNSPIESLAQGLRRYEKAYREAGPGDHEVLFVVTGFSVRASTRQFVQIKDSLPGARLIHVGVVSLPVEAEDLTPSPALNISPSEASVKTAESVTAAASTPFVPTSASLNIQRLANSDRRIDVTFSWGSAADLSGLAGDRSALEVQVLFWNHAAKPNANNVTYVGPVKFWGTNNSFFHSYFDTPALNGSGLAGSPYEREVTIGSYDARSDFQAGRQYTVWAILEKGSLDSNFAKLSFQRGIFMPSLLEDLAVNRACEFNYRRTGKFDPAFCVSGRETVKVTPVNYTGTNYSIVAPTIPSFTYPTATCSIPVGYPDIGNGTRPSAINEEGARNLVSQILPFQSAFTKNGGRSNVGCPVNNVHRDAAWWPRGGFTQDFNGSQTGKGNGAVMLGPGAGQAFWVHGALWTRYSSPQFGGPKSVVGEPTGDEQSVTSSRGSNGAYQAFTKGYLYFNTPRNQTYYVVNAIAEKYRSVGLHTDALGFPIRDEYPWSGGARSDFEGGYIYWTAASGAVIVRNQQKVATPIITPVSGSFSGPVTASASTITSGAILRYTTNGVDPTGSSPTFPGSLTITSSTTLKVRGFKSGMTDSDVTTATYSISTVQKVATPTISPGSGTYTGSVTASASTITSGAILRYTTNGVNPTGSSPTFPGSLTITSSTTLKVRAFKSGMADSDVATAVYTLQTVTPLSASCSISPNPITLGQGATVSARGSGGAPSYRYRINGVDTGTTSSLLVLPSQVGTFSTSVTVTDSRNNQASASCSAQVIRPDPYVTGFRYSPNPAKATRVVSLDIYGGNFVAGTTQVWFVGPGCSGNGCQTNAVSVGSSAYISAQAVLNLTGSYVVNLRNSNGPWVRVGTLTVVP